MDSTIKLARFIFLVLFTIGMFYQIYMPCFHGSNVIAKSNLLILSMYKCDWIPQSKPFKSNMKILMENMKQPIILVAYKRFCYIQLETFVNVNTFIFVEIQFKLKLI